MFWGVFHQREGQESYFMLRPEDVLDDVPDLNPWAEQLSSVRTFCETFFTNVATNPLGDRR